MDRRLGVAAVAASALCYGTLAYFGKLLTAAGIAVVPLLFYRFAIGALALTAVALAVRARLPSRSGWMKSIGLGCFFAAMSTTYFFALTHAGAAYAVLTLYAYPAVVAVLEHALGNRVTAQRLLAVGLALGGIALLVHPGGHLDRAGIAVGLLSAIFYGTYLVLTTRVMRLVPPLPGSLAIVATMAIIFGAATLVTNHSFHIAGEHIALLVVFGIVSTAVPIGLLSYGIPKIGAPRAAVLGTLEPLTAVMLVTFLAGERLDVLQLVGGGLLVLSSVVPDRPAAVPLEG